MKILKFSLLEKLNIDVISYVEDFIGGVDDNDVLNWIALVSKDTNIKEYENSEKESFAESKNLKTTKKYISLIKEIETLNDKIEKIENKKNKLEFEAASEILYKFQEDLIAKDSDSFYNLFIEDSLEYSQVHPDILKKYLEKIKIISVSRKYNL